MTDFKLHFKITFHCTAKEKEIEVVLVVPFTLLFPESSTLGWWVPEIDHGGPQFCKPT
jgi:hypothetical protein